MDKEFEFLTTPSGDFECFVFAVDKKTFIRIKGETPQKYDKNDFHRGKYNLYPSDFFKESVEISVKISIKIVGNPI